MAVRAKKRKKTIVRFSKVKLLTKIFRDDQYHTNLCIYPTHSDALHKMITRAVNKKKQLLGFSRLIKLFEFLTHDKDFS
jgi:hypothetical protein